MAWRKPKRDRKPWPPPDRKPINIVKRLRSPSGRRAIFRRGIKKLNPLELERHEELVSREEKASLFGDVIEQMDARD